jgi:acetyltransferase-like isoleucine patch superfamily enzyme
VLIREFKETFFIFLANILPNLGYFERKRFLLLKWAGVRVDADVIIRGPVEISPRSVGNLSIGESSFINSGCRFSCPDKTITIGNFVKIGARVCFETVDHVQQPIPDQRRGAFSNPIIVEDHAFIGTGAIILSGVRVGTGAIIGAGSVVTKSVPPLTVVAGCPARFIKNI